MKLSIKTRAYTLPLRFPFTISRYTVEFQKTVIVSITDGNISGYGEATENPYYNSTTDKIFESVESVMGLIENAIDLHPSQLWEILEPHLLDDYFALSAIDCAFWDYYGKKHKIRLHEHFNKNDGTSILSSYTIGIDTIDKMLAKITELPWPIYKIKLGTERDIEIIQRIREHTDAKLRIDANCAWTPQQTVEYSKILKGIGVEFIEQPLPAQDYIDMEDIIHQSDLPIFADESCRKLADVEKCSKSFSGINIKLMKCGGLTPALKMIENAREFKLSVMAGCMTESTIGISNLLQISSLVDYLDADGAMLLKEDLATGANLREGRIKFSTEWGSGIKLK